MSEIQPARGLGQAVKRSVAWLIFGRGVSFAIHAGSSVLLARLLEPRTFGIFSIASLFIGFVKQFQGVGMGQATIRHPGLTERHVATFFAVNLLGSTSLCMLLWVGAPLLKALFHEPSAVPVLRLLALGLLLNPLSALAGALVQRRMEFRSQTQADVVFAVVQVGVAVTLAWMGQGVWSLAIAQVVGQVARTGSLVASAGRLPFPRYDHQAARDLAGFGSGIFVKNAVLYAQDRVDYLVVGRWLGAAALGYYERAYRLPEALVKELASTVNRVLFSAYARIQEDRERALAAFRRSLLALTLPTLPALIGLALVAPSFVHVLFGPKWDPTVLPLRILCVAMVFRMLSLCWTTYLNALGHVRVEASVRVAVLIIMVAACVLATRWGIAAVALAIVLVEFLIALATGWILFRVASLSLHETFAGQRPVFVGTGVMAIGVNLFQIATAPFLGPHTPATLIGSIAVGAMLYVGSLFATRNEPLRQVAKDLARGIRPLHRKAGP